jgi:hypothetical protein
MYYPDPDGNQVELQWDVFETNEEVDDFINGPIYQKNPRGVDFDPEEMIVQVRAGRSFEVLTRRTW